MMRLVRSGIVRTGGCDGCGTIGDTVTASPEEDEDMPVGVGRVRGVVGLGWWVISPVAGFSVGLVKAVELASTNSTESRRAGIGKRTGPNSPH
eukprot:scaffold133331_cov62-Phaeocystis_antarctica.AAC.2